MTADRLLFLLENMIKNDPTVKYKTVTLIQYDTSDGEIVCHGLDDRHDRIILK